MNYLKNYEFSKSIKILNNLKFELFKDLGVFNEQFDSIFRLDHQQFGSMQHSLGMAKSTNMNDRSDSLESIVEGVTNLNIFLKERIEDVTDEEINNSKLVILNCLNYLQTFRT